MTTGVTKYVCVNREAASLSSTQLQHHPLQQQPVEAEETNTAHRGCRCHPTRRDVSKSPSSSTVDQLRKHELPLDHRLVQWRGCNTLRLTLLSFKLPFSVLGDGWRSPGYGVQPRAATHAIRELHRSNIPESLPRAFALATRLPPTESRVAYHVVSLIALPPGGLMPPLLPQL